MSKLAQVVVGETASEKPKEAQFGSNEPYLKEKKENHMITKIQNSLILHVLSLLVGYY